MGYHRAGFEVVGVDIKPQPHYPFEFHQADAFDYAVSHCEEFDAIHASPPCQAYSRASHLNNNNYPRLIEDTRYLLNEIGDLWIIENVVGAPLIDPLLLCGGMFGLKTYRHRLFETSFELPFMLHAPHGLQVDKSSGKNRQREMVQVWGNAQYKGYLQRAREAMGIDWMNEEEIAEAIPPAYTEFIGKQLMEII